MIKLRGQTFDGYKNNRKKLDHHTLMLNIDGYCKASRGETVGGGAVRDYKGNVIVAFYSFVCTLQQQRS